MRDILPRERAIWRVAEKAAAEVARSFGYEEMVTPVIEHADLIERVGEDTDAVAKELYRFDDRGGRNLALRPEATAGVVRAYFEGGLSQGPQPSRLYLIGPMFRYDRPQKGRYRQFFQFNVEAIGVGSAALDAEVIELAAGWLHGVGLGELRMELNSIGDAKCRPAYLERLQAYYRPFKSQLHGDCQLRLESNPLRLLDCKVAQCQPFKIGAPRITDHLCEECSAAWAEVQVLVDAAGIEYQLNPHLVRGLDYYTRTVFEWTTDALGSQSTVCAGGRYDGLVAQLGGADTPGVGWAMGQERIVMLLQKQNLELPKDRPQIYLVLVGEQVEIPGFRLAEQLRDAWPGLAVQINLGGGSFKTQFKRADKSGAEFALVLGDDEAGRGVVAVKALRRDSAQEECPVAQISERIGLLLGLKGGSGSSHG